MPLSTPARECPPEPSQQDCAGEPSLTNGSEGLHTQFLWKNKNVPHISPLCSEAYALMLHWGVMCSYMLRLPTYPNTWEWEALGSTGGHDVPVQAGNSSPLAHGLELAAHRQAGTPGWATAAWTFKWYQIHLSLQQAKSELTTAKAEPHRTLSEARKKSPTHSPCSHCTVLSTVLGKLDPEGQLWQWR